MDRLRDWAPFGASAVLVLAAWEAGLRWAGISSLMVPTPSAIAFAFYRGLTGGVYLANVGPTLAELLLGFAFGSAAALVVAMLITRYPLVDAALFPYLVALQCMPKISLAPIFVLWFGFGIASKLALVALVVFFPVLLNLVAGLRSMDPDRETIMRALCASPWQTFRYLRLPAAAPYLFAGLRIALVYGLLATVVAEFVGSQAGLGFLIIQQEYTMDVAGQFSVIILLSLLAVALNYLAGAAERRVIFWQQQAGGLDAREGKL